jgi:hypothetical protein
MQKPLKMEVWLAFESINRVTCTGSDKVPASRKMIYGKNILN